MSEDTQLSTGPQAEKRFRLSLAAAAIVIMALLGALAEGLYATNQSTQKFAELERLWGHYDDGVVEKGRALHRIRDSLGLDGFIHHYKLYILRGEQRSHDAARQALYRFFEAITLYRAHAVDAEEEEALTALEKAAEGYGQRLSTVRNLIAAGRSPAAIDRAARTDNAGAVAALSVLDAAYRDSANAMTAEATAVVAAGRGLVEHDKVMTLVFACIGLIAVGLMAWLLLQTRARLGEIAAASRELGPRARDLERLAESCAMSSRSKSVFLNTMSHELRTPLNAIQGYTEMLRGGAIETERRDAYLDAVLQSARQLLQLVDDVLEVSRHDELGGRHMRREPVDLTALLTDLHAQWERRARDGELTFSLSIPAVPVHVTGDVTALRKALGALISNAIKFTQPAGSIRLSLVSEDDGVTVILEDSGIGIPADQMARLFKPFTQIEREVTGRFHQGTGLGLALSRAIIEGHGGRLEIESARDSGTRVLARLPRTPSQALAAPL